MGRPLAIAQPPEGAVEETLQLFGGAVDGLLESGRLMADRDRLEADETGLQQAALILGAGFSVAVLVAEVDLHPCDVLAETVQGLPHYGFDLLGQRVVAFDVTIGVDPEI